MLVQEIYDFLNDIAPFDTAEEWDNCGLLVGDFEHCVERIYLSLDLSNDVIENAQPNSLIVVHHPFIFKSIKRVDFSSLVGQLIKKAVKKDISVIAAHTNYDKAVLNTFFTKNILGFETFTSTDFVCQVDIDMDFDSLLARVKNSMATEHLEFVRPKNSFVKKIGVTTGSGSEFIFSSGVDVYLTGDVKYHSAFEAKERGVGVIDISHYASELCFSDSLAKILNILPIEVIITNSKNPFEHC